MPEAIGTPNPARREEIKRDVLQKQLRQQQEKLRQQRIPVKKPSK